MQQMWHHTKAEHKQNDNFAHCNYSMILPCNAAMIMITCAFNYAIIIAFIQANYFYNP